MKLSGSPGRFYHRYRRFLAAVLVGLAVWLLASHFVPEPDGTPVVVAAHDLSLGSTISAGDVKMVRLPSSATPEGAFDNPAQAIGALAGANLSPGTVLQPGLLSGETKISPGRAHVPVLIEDQQLVAFLSPGLQVTLVSEEPSQTPVITKDAVVIQTLAGAQSSLGSGGGNAWVIFEVPESAAPAVAALGQAGSLDLYLSAE